MSRTTNGPRFGTVPYSVRDAAQRLGLSERGVLKRIHARTLTAERDGKRWLVFLPSEPSSERFRTEDGTGSEPIEVQYRVTPAEIEQAIERTGDKYLADMQAMLAPLVAQITEQAETIGQLRTELDHTRQSAEAAIAKHDQVAAERDELLAVREDLRIRLAELEAIRRSSQDTLLTGIEASSAPETATDAAADTSWWQFWRR